MMKLHKDFDFVYSNTISCSKFIMKTTNSSHHFVIHGYSLVKGLGMGKYIISDTLIIGGYHWAICFIQKEIRLMIIAHLEYGVELLFTIFLS